MYPKYTVILTNFNSFPEVNTYSEVYMGRFYISSHLVTARLSFKHSYYDN